MIKQIILFVSLVFACQALTDDEVAQEWKNFQELTGKSYSSPVEATKRFAIFKKNLEDIEAHNKLYDQGLKTFQKGVTKFADWTSEEFMGYLSKFQVATVKDEERVKVAVDRTNLTSVNIDWRKKGRVTPVKDQGDCEASWAFSAVGAIEGQARKYMNLRDAELSVQEILDCVSGSCQEGSVMDAYSYATIEGLQTESEYPYSGVINDCKASDKKAVHLLGVSKLWPDIYQIEDTLRKDGPLSVGLEATPELQHYKSGIFIDDTCTDKINMNALIVGFGNGDDKDDPRIEYWIIKNSWGEHWGEEGYFRFFKGGNQCGILNSVTSPALSCNIHSLPNCF